MQYPLVTQGSQAVTIASSVVTLPGLRRHRQDAALSVRDLAVRSGVSPATIVRAEAGREMNPSTIRKLAEALEIKPRELMEGEPT